METEKTLCSMSPHKKNSKRSHGVVWNAENKESFGHTFPLDILDGLIHKTILHYYDNT